MRYPCIGDTSPDPSPGDDQKGYSPGGKRATVALDGEGGRSLDRDWKVDPLPPDGRWSDPLCPPRLRVGGSHSPRPTDSWSGCPNVRSTTFDRGPR